MKLSEKAENKFRAIKVKIGDKDSPVHHLYLKQHLVRKQSKDIPRSHTLFVCNVPPFLNKESFEIIFKECGELKTVHFTSRPVTVIKSETRCVCGECEQVYDPKGYKIAYVVFESTEGLEKALTWEPKKPVVLSLAEANIVTGFQKYLQDHMKKYANVDEIVLETEQYLKEFEKRVLRQKHEDEQSAIPDEGGWITVTKSGRKPGFSREKEGKIRAKMKAKRARKELKNFYRFQIKDAKKKEFEKLKQRYDEDKKKVEAMKSQRKFRPLSM